MVDAAKKTRRVVTVGSQGRCHPVADTLRSLLAVWRNWACHPCRMLAQRQSGGWGQRKNRPALRPISTGICGWALQPAVPIIQTFATAISVGSWTLEADKSVIAVRMCLTWFHGFWAWIEPGRVELKRGGNGPRKVFGIVLPTSKSTTPFERPDVTISWKQPGVQAADFQFGAVYHGTRGKTIVRGGDGRVFPDEQVVAFAQDNNLPFEIDRGVRAHEINLENWFDCIRSRKTPIMDIETGHRVASMCILANMAYKLERPLEWNARRERFDRDPAASMLLASPGRGRYSLYS